MQFRSNSIVHSVRRAERSESFDHITINTKVSLIRTTEMIPCKALVIAAGPWSSSVFSNLFPDAQVKLHMNTTWAAGNHVRVRSSRWTSPDSHDSTQVFLNNVLPDSKTMDITSFTDGSLNLGGWGAVPQPLPGSAYKVKPQQEEINTMVELARQYLHLELDDDLETFEAGRCYRPRASPNRPIITKVHWSLLENPGNIQGDKPYCGSDLKQKTLVDGGLYINTGHGSDGITLALGSGKVMSELLLGRTPSVPVSAFDLKNDVSNEYVASTLNPNL